MDAKEIHRRVGLAFMWSALAVGLTGIGLWIALPPFYDVADACDMQTSAEHAFDGDWLVLRGPAGPGPAPRFNPSDNTTLVTPGCGERAASFSFRVRGDHTGFKDQDDRLVLSGDKDAERVYGQTEGGQVVVPGEFEEHSPWWSVTFLAVAPAALLTALGLRLRIDSNLWFGLAGPSLLATVLAHAAFASRDGVLLVALMAPFAVLPAWAVQPRPRGWGIVLLTLAALAVYAGVVYGTWWAFRGLYPALQ